MLSHVQPMHDYVMIRRLPDRQVGHIIIADTIDTKPRIGIVEAVGPGRKLCNGTRAYMAVKVGDRVKFSLDSGFVNWIPGERPGDARLLIRERDIEAILEPEAEASALGSPWPGYIVDGPQDHG